MNTVEEIKPRKPHAATAGLFVGVFTCFSFFSVPWCKSTGGRLFLVNMYFCWNHGIFLSTQCKHWSLTFGTASVQRIYSGTLSEGCVVWWDSKEFFEDIWGLKDLASIVQTTKNRTLHSNKMSLFSPKNISAPMHLARLTLKLCYFFPNLMFIPQHCGAMCFLPPSK